jgi:hypothetical protein
MRLTFSERSVKALPAFGNSGSRNPQKVFMKAEGRKIVQKIKEARYNG